MNIEVEPDIWEGLWDIEDLPAREMESKFFLEPKFEAMKEEASELSLLMRMVSLSSLEGVCCIIARTSE